MRNPLTKENKAMTMTDQLGFADLLAEAGAENEARKFARKTAHLPDTMDEAVPVLRALIERHHAAMLAADVEAAMRLREEAHLLAEKLDVEDRGILAGEDAPGRVLARRTAALPGAVPLWGQAGDFVLETCGMRVRIEMDGVFGIAATFVYWPGFSAHAVERARPFLSETGYRSFLGIHADRVPGLTPDSFAAKVIASHVQCELRGRLLAIDPQWGRRVGA